MFSDRLKHALSLAKLTRSQLAEKLGTSAMTVHQWCMKRIPRHETIQLIAEALNVSAVWLANGEGSPQDTATELPLTDPGPVTFKEQEAVYRLVASLPGKQVMELAYQMSQAEDPDRNEMGLQLASLKAKLEADPGLLERILTALKPKGGQP